MKINKFLCLIASFAFLYNAGFSYAQNDISSIIFSEDITYNDNFQNELVFEISNIPNTYIDSDIKNEIDDIVEKALIKALKEEEEKIKLNAVSEKESYLKTNSDNYQDRNFYSNNEIIDFAKTVLGTPYVYGGTTLKGFDCSGFVKYVYSNFGINLPRTTYSQIKLGYSVSIDSIKENDLIFFDTRAKEKLLSKSKNMTSSSFEEIIINEADIEKTPSKLNPTQATHVALYIGNGQFIHASSSKKKVVIDEINSPYFRDRIVDIKRYI